MIPSWETNMGYLLLKLGIMERGVIPCHEPSNEYHQFIYFLVRREISFKSI